MKKALILALFLSMHTSQANSILSNIGDSFFNNKVAFKSFERTDDGRVFIFKKYPRPALVMGPLMTLAGLGLVAYPFKAPENRLVGAVGGFFFLVMGATTTAYAIKGYSNGDVPALVLSKDGMWYEGNTWSGELFMSWDDIQDVVSHVSIVTHEGVVTKSYYLKVVNSHAQEVLLRDGELSVSLELLKSFFIEFLNNRWPEKAKRLQNAPIY